MSRRVSTEQMSVWIERCRSNVRRFAERRASMTPAQQVEFIRQQYAILRVLVDVAEGGSYLRGVQPPSRATAPPADS